MVKAIKDQAASIRQRLLSLSRSDGIVFEVVLINYGLERLIYRLSVSQYREKFVLKGGMLVALWTQDPNRVTRDADFLGYADPDMGHLKSLFTEIMNIESEDGLNFDTGNMAAEAIKEGQEYAGVRLRTIAYLGKTQIHITIDIGFGDVVTDDGYESKKGHTLAKVRKDTRLKISNKMVHCIQSMINVLVGFLDSGLADDIWITHLVVIE